MNHHCTKNDNTNESFIRPLIKPAISPPTPNLMSLLAFVIRCKWSSTCSVVVVVSNTFLLVHVGCFNGPKTIIIYRNLKIKAMKFNQRDIFVRTFKQLQFTLFFFWTLSNTSFCLRNKPDIRNELVRVATSSFQ